MRLVFAMKAELGFAYVMGWLYLLRIPKAGMFQIFLVCSFGATFPGTQGILLALCSGELSGVQDWTWLDHLKFKCLIHCTNIVTPGLCFLNFLSKFQLDSPHFYFSYPTALSQTAACYRFYVPNANSVPNKLLLSTLNLPQFTFLFSGQPYCLLHPLHHSLKGLWKQSGSTWTNCVTAQLVTHWRFPPTWSRISPAWLAAHAVASCSRVWPGLEWIRFHSLLSPTALSTSHC